jgi:hypothetical protein
VNKAIAKELYIDSVINVVSPKKSGKKGVIPGQMNLFNPVGQADLNSYYEAHNVEPMSNISPEKSKYLGISDL